MKNDKNIDGIVMRVYFRWLGKQCFVESMVTLEFLSDPIATRAGIDAHIEQFKSDPKNMVEFQRLYGARQ